MKRLTLLLLGLALGVSATASAQGLTMQMSNGWSFQFSGNVNAFWVFSDRFGASPLGGRQSRPGGQLRVRQAGVAVRLRIAPTMTLSAAPAGTSPPAPHDPLGQLE